MVGIRADSNESSVQTVSNQSILHFPGFFYYYINNRYADKPYPWQKQRINKTKLIEQNFVLGDRGMGIPGGTVYRGQEPGEAVGHLVVQ